MAMIRRRVRRGFSIGFRGLRLFPRNRYQLRNYVRRLSNW